MGDPEMGVDLGDDLEIELKGTRPLSEEPPAPPTSPTGPVAIRAVGEVLDDIGRHVRVDTSVEQGGVLVGHVEETTGTTVVTGSIVAVGAVSQVASLTFTHETWDHVNEVLATEYPSDQMVGWYHSHPRFGIFLSEYDQFIHNNFFPAPYHIAYVVDPVDDEHGFFGWDDGNLVRVPRWETIRVEDGRRPEADVGQPVRSDRDRGAGPPPVIVRTGNDGVRPGLVGLLVVLVALLVGTIAYMLGASDEGEVEAAPPVTEVIPPGPTEEPDSPPPPTQPPVPVAAPVQAVICLSPQYWPILRSDPDDAVLNGPVLASGVTGLALTGEDSSTDGRTWVEVATPQGTGWLPADVLIELAADVPGPVCSYRVAAEGLNVRASPGVTDDLIVGELTADQAVDPTGFGVMLEGRPWVEIEAGALRGFVNASYLALVNASGPA